MPDLTIVLAAASIALIAAAQALEVALRRERRRRASRKATEEYLGWLLQ
jgi:hypothetical protein